MAAGEAPADDVALLADVARGDAGAFRELHRRHESRVRRLAYGVLLDADEAADVAQEVFVRLHREAGRWRPEAKLSSWLHRVALNEALSVRRRLSRALRFGSTLAAGSGLERSFELRESVAFFRRAMPLLSPLQRAIVTLHLDEELAPAEIAPLVGRTPNAARVTLHRALETLRREAKTRGIELPADELLVPDEEESP